MSLLIKPIFSVLAHAEKQFFSKLVFEFLCHIVIKTEIDTFETITSLTKSALIS